MNKIIITLICLLFILSSVQAKHIKQSKVPAAVLNAFKAKYPSVTKATWELEDGNYEAEFDVNKMENSVLFDANGNLMETEMAIPVTQLPEKVKQYVSSTLGGKKIKEAAIIDTKGVKKYEAQVGKKDYIFDENGNYLNSSK